MVFHEVSLNPRTRTLHALGLVAVCGVEHIPAHIVDQYWQWNGNYLYSDKPFNFGVRPTPLVVNFQMTEAGSPLPKTLESQKKTYGSDDP